MDCSPPGFSVLGILQARILEWVDIPFSRRSSQPRGRTQAFLSYCRWFLYHLSHFVCFLSNWEEESQVSSAPTTLTSSCTDLLLLSLCARNEGQPLLLWSTPQIWPPPFIYPFPLPLLVQLTMLQISTSSLNLVPSQPAIYPSSSFKWPLMILWASLVAQRLKRLPAMRETWVRSLGCEDPLEKEMATHSSILAWRIPWMEEPGGLQSTGS